MDRPKIILYVDMVSPLTYEAIYILQNESVFRDIQITYVPIFLGGLLKTVRVDGRPSEPEETNRPLTESCSAAKTPPVHIKSEPQQHQAAVHRCFSRSPSLDPNPLTQSTNCKDKDVWTILEDVVDREA
ncbi:putative Glutathione S-transferase kappa [Seiridium unicorne]|uniref:Glutathione S-transferase kappa n=1 Tax=Seiridium unicorne TaxID=138068 RepID=A0ABR2VC62_9PEZI